MSDTTILCFLSVCSTLNFTASAKQLHMSQQAVSRQILSLEQELGHTLFTRNYHSLELTDIGYLYYELFLRWNKEFRRTQGEAARLAAGEERPIRISYLKRLRLPDELNAVISAFKKQHPNTILEYRETVGDTMAQSLVDGEFDFCISHVQIFFQHMQNLSVRRIQDEQKYLTISKRHPAYREHMSLGELQDVVYLFTIMEDQTLRSAVEEVRTTLAPTGIGIREFREADTDEALYLSVSMGEGVTIASNVTTIFHQADIAAFPLGLTSELAVGWNATNTNSQVQSLASMICARFPTCSM
jgi:DNA-binding transcriptional LysR family regulator